MNNRKSHYVVDNRNNHCKTGSGTKMTKIKVRSIFCWTEQLYSADIVLSIQYNRTIFDLTIKIRQSGAVWRHRRRKVTKIEKIPFNWKKYTFNRNEMLIHRIKILLNIIVSYYLDLHLRNNDIPFFIFIEDKLEYKFI